MTIVLSELTRGSLVESLFRGDIAVVDAGGRLVASAGDPHKVTFWRSSAKPIQALAVIAEGAAAAFGFGDRHLSIFAASHNSEPVHHQAVSDALSRAGLSPSDLQCGPHRPLDKETAEAMAARGEEPTPIHSNCSGKHTGMLPLAKQMGGWLIDYMEPDSEVQQVILKHVAAAVGLEPGDIAIGVDGCGVPVFGMPLSNMALSFARLAQPEQMPGAGLAKAARQMRDAMLNEPYMVAGRRRICTDLMNLPGRRCVAKSGAEGVYCAGALPHAVADSPVLRAMGVSGAIGIAVKVEDGHSGVRHQAVVETLSQLGLLSKADREALAAYGPSPIKNYAGKVVGEFRPAFTLQRH